MADDTRSDRSGGTGEFRALSDVRLALDAVELEQGKLDQERRRLRNNLDGLLSSLRDGALLLLFDAEGELAGAEGNFEEHLGASLDDLIKRFDDFAPEETRQSLAAANEAVMETDASGVCISRSFLVSNDDHVGLTWVHLRRHDDDENLVGTEVIGLVPPGPFVDEESEDRDEDPFERLLEQLGRRLLDSSEESTIRRSIEIFGDFISADRVVINRYDEDSRTFSIMTSWLRGKTEPLPAEAAGISISALPWAYSLLSAGESVLISERADLPSEASAEKRIYARDGVRASLLVPMVRNDHLFGFVSIQSERQPDWDVADITRARAVVRLLSGTLARRELEADLAEALDAAESAQEEVDSADERREKAEGRARESDEKIEALASGAKESEARIEELEKDLEKLEEAEREARSAQKELEEALQEATSALAELGDAGDAEEETPEVGQRASTKLRSLGGLESAAAIELRGTKAAAGGFDPDATLEMEFSSLVKRRQGGPDDVMANVAQVDQAEEATEFRSANPGPQRGLGGEASSSFDLETMVEHTQSGAAAGLKEARQGTVEPSWGGGFSDKALPGWLLEEEGNDQDGPDDRNGDDEAAEDLDDETAEDRDESDPDDRSDVRSRGDEGEDAGQDEERDLAAARSMARRAATIDEGRRGSDWWGVRVDDDVNDGYRADVDDERTDADTGDDHAHDDDDIVFETAWDRQDTAADDVEEWETAPPSGRASFAREGEDEDAGADEDEIRDRGGDDDEHADGEAGDDVGDRAEQHEVALSDLEGIDAEIGLQDVGGNEELYRSLLTKFRNDYSGAGAKIDAAIEKGNIEVAHLLLHAIKGVSGILGATRLRETADELETRLIGKDPDATRESVGGFVSALEEVLGSIAVLDGSAASGADEADSLSASAGWDEDPEESPEGVSDPMVLRSYLSGLRQHLVAEKPRQCRLVMREIDARTWPEDYDDRVQELGELIGGGDFADARDVFEDLMEMFEEA